MADKKQILCSCGNCHKIFDLRDCSYKIADIYGVFIKEKVCPYCSSLGYTRLDQEKFFDKYDKEMFY